MPLIAHSQRAEIELSKVQYEDCEVSLPKPSITEHGTKQL